MKRFYCTVCKKIKRVRDWPVKLENEVSPLVLRRVGECNNHATGGYVKRARRVERVETPVYVAPRQQMKRKAGR